MKTVLPEEPATPDILWKEIIIQFFRYFVAFFKPEFAEQILYEQTEFLDKELLSITGKPRQGIVDVLAKVYLTNGTAEYILFHVEVQGYPGENFQERMFSYFIRIWDRHRQPVLSLAILTHKLTSQSLQNVYEIDAFGTALRYQYNVFHISSLDYAKCLGSQNCVEVGLAILAENTEVALWRKKLEVIKNLLRLGLSPKEVHLMVSFVDRLSPLKPQEEQQFKKYVIEEEKEVKMILTSFEERGIEKGLERGIERGKFDALMKIIQTRFGTVPANFLTKLQQIHQIEKLDELIQLAVQVDHLEKIIAWVEEEQLN